MVQAQRTPEGGLGRKEHQNGTQILEFKDFIGISGGCKNHSFGAWFKSLELWPFNEYSTRKQVWEWWKRFLWNNGFLQTQIQLSDSWYAEVAHPNESSTSDRHSLGKEQKENHALRSLGWSCAGRSFRHSILSSGVIWVAYRKTHAAYRGYLTIYQTWPIEWVKHSSKAEGISQAPETRLPNSQMLRALGNPALKVTHRYHSSLGVDNEITGEGVFGYRTVWA